MKQVKVEIYEQGRYYGTLRMVLGPMVSEEELTSEIERRLPSLKNRKYEICFA